jgi:hypothetical protein
VIFRDFCSNCAFGGLFDGWKKKILSHVRVIKKAFQGILSTTDLHVASICIDNDFSLLTWICVFFAVYTIIVQFVLDPRRIEEEKAMEPYISIQSSFCVRFWVSGRVFGYLFIWLCWKVGCRRCCIVCLLF